MTLQTYSLVVVSLLLMGPSALAFAPIPVPANRRHSANLRRPWETNLRMKNLFTREDDVSMTMNAFWKRNAPERQDSGSTSSGDMMKFFSQNNGEEEEEESMYMQEQGEDMSNVLVLGVAALAALGVGFVGTNVDIPNPADMVSSVQDFFQDPSGALEGVVAQIEAMGPAGALYFGLIYTLLEVLAVPAIMPLTASAGYLFGVAQGTAIVLTSASIAAAIAFVIGRTFLRSSVETMLQDFPKFQKLDKAIGKEGFKLMLLLRLSPIFPFAASNYLYGASSISFWPFFWGTLLGFAPGTLAYVYTGVVGKALTLGGGEALPWYAYGGGLVLLAGVLKVVADVASAAIEELEEESV